MGPLAPRMKKGVNLIKTKSEMVFPGCEKSGPCGLVDPNSTKWAIHKGLERLTSERRGSAGHAYCCASSAGVAANRLCGSGPQSPKCPFSKAGEVLVP